MEKLTKIDVENKIKRIAEHMAAMLLEWKSLDEEGLSQEFTTDRKFGIGDDAFDLHAVADEDEIHIRVTRADAQEIEDCVCGQCNE